MTKRLMLLLLLGALVVGAQGKEVAKVEMPDALTRGKSELKLNGNTLRSKTGDCHHATPPRFKLLFGG